MIIQYTALTVVIYVIRFAESRNDFKPSFHFPAINFTSALSTVRPALSSSQDVTTYHRQIARTTEPKDLHKELLNFRKGFRPTNGSFEVINPQRAVHLSPEQIRNFFDQNEKQLRKVLKKSRWREKVQNKLINKYKEKRQREDEDEENMRQLNELYDLQNPMEELEDEAKDAEIFKAIYTSVMFHQKTWAERFFNRFKKHRRVKRDEEVVCYKDLGCFRDEGPFDYFDMLPNSPEEINTQFMLHSKENPTREQYLFYQNASTIINSNFRSNRKTKVIIHGFGSSCHRVWVREMRNTFLKMEDVNVICVQWEDGATTPNYVRAASNTRLVGSQVAVFLEKLRSVTNMSLVDVHLIGFSLGAHVSGYAGQRLPGLGRISGLDPAGPLFESFPPNMRLDASDANFVDVIHTNADSLLWGGLGAYDPMGHVDFYPNGGRVQKGCKNLFVGGVSDILWPKEGDGRYLCNHRRGYKYFMESAVPICKFPSFVCHDYDTFLKGDCFPCKECGNMGYYADKAQGRGQLFLVTRDEEPFCANQFKIEIWHSGGPPTTELVSTQGRFDVTFVTQDGKNETINVTRDTGKKMEAGSRTVSIIVLHVALSVIANIQVQYTSYRGWISSGYNRWAIDKMSIMSNSGKIQSFCHRGLTMESGLTMLFPLVQGDCNPREITLHPLPVLPWPGIEYNIPNGVHRFQYSSTPTPSSSPPGIDGGHTRPPNSSRPTIQPHAVEHSRPSGTTDKSSLSSTFSVIYSLPNEFNNYTEVGSRNNTINKFRSDLNVTLTTGENEEKDPLANQTSMSTEEYIAWKQAPPPNLNTRPKDASQHVIIPVATPQLTHSPTEINYIPQSNGGTVAELSSEKQKHSYDFSNPSTEDSLIREDAQVTDINERKSEDNIHAYGLSRDEFFFTADSSLFEADDSDFTGLLKSGLKIPMTIRNNHPKHVAEEPSNSVIEGEVPFKERARAIKFGPSPNDYPPVASQVKDFESNYREGDSGTSQPSNNPSQLASHSSQINSRPEFTREQEIPTKGETYSYDQFSYGGSPSSFRQDFTDSTHTFPPTVLKPPKIQVVYSHREVAENIPYSQQQSAFIPQKSNLFGRHRYIPRAPMGFRPYEGRVDHFPTASFDLESHDYPSELSLRAVSSYHVPSYSPYHHTTPFARPFKSHSFRPFSKRTPPPLTHGYDRSPYILKHQKSQNSESRLPKLFPFLSQRFSAVPAFKRLSGHLRSSVSQAPNLPPSISRVGTTKLGDEVQRRNMNAKVTEELQRRTLQAQVKEELQKRAKSAGRKAAALDKTERSKFRHSYAPDTFTSHLDSDMNERYKRQGRRENFNLTSDEHKLLLSFPSPRGMPISQSPAKGLDNYQGSKPRVYPRQNHRITETRGP